MGVKTLSIFKNSRGFTLIEVCVASVIFAIGALSIGMVYSHFQNLRRQELQTVYKEVCSIGIVEQLGKTPVECKDTLFLKAGISPFCNLQQVNIARVPGSSKLGVATIEVKPEKFFKRIIQCK